MKMILYKWDSLYLLEAGRGSIFVMAPSVDEAKVKALAEFYRYDKETYQYQYSDDLTANDIWKYSKEINDRKAIFMTDIEIAPTIVENGVFFIEGSS